MLKLNERVALITLNFRKTTGNIQLNQTEFSPEDLAHLPPGFRLGTKPVIERKRLTVFDSLKDEATLLLKNHGIEFMTPGSFIVPIESYKGFIKDELNRICARYETEVKNLLAHWNEYCEAFIKANPNCSPELLRKGRPSVERIERSFKSEYMTAKIVPVEGDEGEVETRLSNLSENLISSVAADCRNFLQKNKPGRSSAKSGSRVLLQRILTRCKELEFISPRVTPLIEFLQNCLNKLPVGVSYTGNLFGLVNGVLFFLSDERTLKRLCDGTLDTSLVFGGYNLGETGADVLPGLYGLEETDKDGDVAEADSEDITAGTVEAAKAVETTSERADGRRVVRLVLRRIVLLYPTGILPREGEVSPFFLKGDFYGFQSCKRTQEIGCYFFLVERNGKSRSVLRFNKR